MKMKTTTLYFNISSTLFFSSSGRQSRTGSVHENKNVGRQSLYLKLDNDHSQVRRVIMVIVRISPLCLFFLLGEENAALISVLFFFPFACSLKCNLNICFVGYY